MHMQRCLILTVLLVTVSTYSMGCFNEMRVLLSGKKIEASKDDMEIPSGRDLLRYSKHYKDELRKMDSLWKSSHSIRAYSDYGVILVYLGKYQEAKAVFEEIENIEPNLYATAANIGTLYELLGENELALKWIKRAIEINPNSHYRSEWIHVNILEAKIKGDEFITTDFLLNNNLGNAVAPASSKTEKELVELSRQIFYQLNERMTFIKPEDKIVGLLLFELGNIYAITSDVTLALRVYDKAKEYGYSSSLLYKRYEKFLSLHEGMDNEYGVMRDKENSKAAFDSNTRMILWFVAMIIVLGIVLFIVKRLGNN
jgi:tetratricopeptide (TPR) repeat protein